MEVNVNFWNLGTKKGGTEEEEVKHLRVSKPPQPYGRRRQIVNTKSIHFIFIFIMSF